MPRARHRHRDRDARRDDRHARLRSRPHDPARRRHRARDRRSARRYGRRQHAGGRRVLPDRRARRLRRGQRRRGRRRTPRERRRGPRFPRFPGRPARRRDRDRRRTRDAPGPRRARLARRVAPPPRPAQARRPAGFAVGQRPGRRAGKLSRHDCGVAAKKLVLTYVDSLRTDMLRRSVVEGRAPTFGALIERGVLIEDCVSSFPSVTPVACAEIATGAGADRHWISGMNWYHRLERRYVEYGSSLGATRAFGVFQALYDLVYNLNLAHLNPDALTLFERLDDAGLRTACTPFLIYRGRRRHQVSLDGLLRRAVEATRLKFRHHTWGPAELFYGDLYASSEVPCKPSSIPGSRDGYSACCAAELAKRGGFDFLLFSLPDNDAYSHRHGPEG